MELWGGGWIGAFDGFGLGMLGCSVDIAGGGGLHSDTREDVFLEKVEIWM